MKTLLCTELYICKVVYYKETLYHKDYKIFLKTDSVELQHFTISSEPLE